MARIDIKSAGATLNDGVLQLENGVAMDATLRNVADQNNTTSPLKLSTNLVQTTSTLKITTDNNPYIDAEDGSSNNRFTVGRDSSSQQVNVDFASNPTGSTTTVGAIRTYQDGVNLSEVVKFREDGQVTFSERVNVEADSLVTTQSSSVIAATTTNANLVIAPNGTGALVASIPDGTVAGGNARGVYAVDLQMGRNNIANVASGNNATIGGGYSNKASGLVAPTVAGGQYNFATGLFWPTVGGGSQNIASGQASTVSGGQLNTASSDNSVISGGQSNTASSSSHATVVGGLSNTSSGQYSVSGGNGNSSTSTGSISFGSSNISSGGNSFTMGNSNTASGIRSFAIGGLSNTASSDYAINLGGLGCLSSSEYTITSGNRTYSYLFGQKSHSGISFSTTRGEVQESTLTANREATLTTGGTTTLSLDGTGTTNLIIPNGTNRMWNVQVAWVAVVTAITGTATGVTVGDTKVSTDLLAVAKRAGVTTVSAHTSAATHAIETIAGSLTAANITYSAGASQQMAITFTGPTFAGGGSVTMRVVARVQLTEVAY